MTTSEAADPVSDVIVPCLLIAGLIIGNAIIFAFIIRARKRLTNPVHEDVEEVDGSAGNAIEMQRL